jgi:UPF0755 protein
MKLRRTSIFGVVVGLLLCLGGTALWLKIEMDNALASKLNLTEPIIYEIKSGQSLAGVTRDLTEMRILERPVFLIWHSRLNGKASVIKAGEYQLSPGLSAADLLDLFVSGRVFQRSLTIVEGWTFLELLDAVRNAPALESTLDGVAPENIMAKIGFSGIHPEGRFLPDTYHFPKGTSDADFLIRAYRAMEHYLDEAWRGREAGLPFDTPNDALILASIVEKETAVAEERGRIAGVFVERLRRGMRLQTDPTVIYGIGAGFDGNLRRRDLDRDTPYNTYTRKGLPPTPIANPGTASITAVMHPVVDGSLYFVAKGDGSHHFSSTYEEHNQAVTRYQLRRKSRNNKQGG